VIGYVVVAVLGLFAVLALGYMAWAGEIKLGRRVLADRRQDGLGFWAVWLILLAVYGYILVRFVQETKLAPTLF
jgi:hypothetical protein